MVIGRAVELYNFFTNLTPSFCPRGSGSVSSSQFVFQAATAPGFFKRFGSLVDKDVLLNKAHTPNLKNHDVSVQPTYLSMGYPVANLVIDQLKQCMA